MSTAAIREYRPEDATERQALGVTCERAVSAKEGLLYFSPTPGLMTVSLIAVIGEQRVGFLDGDVIMAPDETGMVKPVRPPQGYVHCIGVHPDHWHEGIGRRLLWAALRAYEDAGCVRMELCTPFPEAAAFFTACGGRRFEHPGVPHRGEGGSFEWKLPLGN